MIIDRINPIFLGWDCSQHNCVITAKLVRVSISKNGICVKGIGFLFYHVLLIKGHFKSWVWHWAESSAPDKYWLILLSEFTRKHVSFYQILLHLMLQIKIVERMILSGIDCRQNSITQILSNFFPSLPFVRYVNISKEFCQFCKLREREMAG